MRIVAGKLKRRKLLTNPGVTTRPITDRVKEQLFENLGGVLNGERVADVFAGTGTIGLEAISRGASSAVFFERDQKAVALLKNNIKALQVADSTLCWKVDIRRTSFKPKGIEGVIPYDLIFFDPPYKLCDVIKPGHPLFASLQRLARPDVSAEDAKLIFRTPERQQLVMPECWQLDWDMDLSTMKIHVFAKAAGSFSESASKSLSDSQ